MLVTLDRDVIHCRGKQSFEDKCVPKLEFGNEGRETTIHLSPFTVHAPLLTKRRGKDPAGTTGYTGRCEASVTSSEQVPLIAFTVSFESVPLSSSIADRTLRNPCNIFTIIG